MNLGKMVVLTSWILPKQETRRLLYHMFSNLFQQWWKVSREEKLGFVPPGKGGYVVPMKKALLVWLDNVSTGTKIQSCGFLGVNVQARDGGKTV